MNIPNGFFKVSHEGGSLVTANFYNPETKETIHKVVRDYDYSDCSRDDDELYNMPINEEIKKIWLHDRGIIQVGDRVKVVKGRTLPHGSVLTVRAKYDYKDQYKRYVATYLYFEEGGKINENNVELI